MRLQKSSAYAVFATLHVAANQETGAVPGRIIADAYGIPEEYLLKILQRLARHGVLRSETGRAGGFRLQKAAEETNLLEIVEAIEGPINGEMELGTMVTKRGVVGGLLEDVYASIAQHTKRLLRETTVRKLMDADAPTVASRAEPGEVD